MQLTGRKGTTEIGAGIHKQLCRTAPLTNDQLLYQKNYSLERGYWEESESLVFVICAQR